MHVSYPERGQCEFAERVMSAGKQAGIRDSITEIFKDLRESLDFKIQRISSDWFRDVHEPKFDAQISR